jgi:uncharacterized protein YecT (DUF1311 family)
MRTTVSILFILLATGAAAADSAPLYKTRDCGKEMVQADMNECAGANLAAADAELNRVYAKLMSEQGDQPSKDQLKDVERAWMAYRDKECAFEIGPQNQGGSIWPMAMDNCLQEKTDTRIRELKPLLDCAEGDPSCKQ